MNGLALLSRFVYTSLQSSIRFQEREIIGSLISSLILLDESVVGFQCGPLERFRGMCKSASLLTWKHLVSTFQLLVYQSDPRNSEGLTILDASLSPLKRHLLREMHQSVFAFGINSLCFIDLLLNISCGQHPFSL